MKHAATRRAFFALLTLLAAMLACTFLLSAQTPQTSQDSAATVATDPAFVDHANVVLLRARSLLDGFFDRVSNAECKENVSQMMVDKKNKPFYHEDSVFDYQLLVSNKTGTLRLTESREMRKASFRDPYKSLLITKGFANMLLILHQNYEASYVFSPIAEEQANGHTLFKYHFEAVPGTSSPAAIQLSGRNYPLQLHGDLWIEEGSGAVVKLVSSLVGGLDDLGLHDLRSEVQYSYVQFHDPEEAFWLPVSAVIDVETPKQHWRNMHRFSEYHRFRVTIQVDQGAEKP
jgi:hypothetical protein